MCLAALAALAHQHARAASTGPECRETASADGDRAR